MPGTQAGQSGATPLCSTRSKDGERPARRVLPPCPVRVLAVLMTVAGEQGDEGKRKLCAQCHIPCTLEL